MNICTAHPHSSEKTARACYEKRTRKRADRKLLGAPTPVKVPAHYRPPITRDLGGIEVYIFYEEVILPSLFSA